MQTPTRMRQLRTTRGWTQADVVKLTGLNQATVSHAERGIATAATLMKIAAVLGEAEPERLLERTWNAGSSTATVIQRNLQDALTRLVPR
jgi:transcriptional regulator with XRE-family HTH domain